MRLFLIGCVLALGGCGMYSSPGHWRNVESSTEDWSIPTGTPETKVSQFMTYDELIPYMDAEEASGWEVIGVHPAGKEFPSKYFVSFRLKQ